MTKLFLALHQHIKNKEIFSTSYVQANIQEEIRFQIASKPKLLLQALMAGKLAACFALSKVKNTLLSVLNSLSFHRFYETRILCLRLLGVLSS